MGEKPRYTVIVDRISHEVEYYRGYLKHAAMEALRYYNPFLVDADDNFQLFGGCQAGDCHPKTVLLRKRVIRKTWILRESLHKPGVSDRLDGFLDFVGRPAI